MGHAGTNRISEKNSTAWTEACTEAMHTGLETARETVASNPAAAVFTAFGAGLGVGLGLALVVASRSPPPLDYGLREKFSQFMSEHAPWLRG